MEKARLSVRLRVSGGKELSRTVSYSTPVITIGRGAKNDLILRDGMVSQYHGELVQRPGSYIYRDLMSRHGTVVVLDHRRIRLHDRQESQEVAITSGAQLLIGESSIQVELGEAPSSRQLPEIRAGRLSEPLATGGSHLDERDHILARTYDSLDVVTRRLSSQDPRMASIFKLSRNLNAATTLDQILELIVESTFEAFPAANFFAITLLPQDISAADIHQATTLISRARQAGRTDIVSPLLSTSLLEQVAHTRESVLFVRDFADHDISQSIINARITACLAAPLVGQRNLIGVMQADTRGLGGLFGSDDLDLFTVMASYAAFGIERARLNSNILEMFEGIVRASTKAIDARDPATAGHSGRVANLAVALAQAVNTVHQGPLKDLFFSDAELLELRYAALLHDFGKIGVRESILTKGERLYETQKEMLLERFHTIKAVLVARIVQRELEKSVASQTAITPEQQAQVEFEIQQTERRLGEVMHFILDYQVKGQIPAPVIERIREIGQQRFTDLARKEHPFIPPKELSSLCIPDGTLTPEEWADMASHVERSREYLQEIPWSPELVRVPTIVASHHEKLDGSGYPNRLSGRDILPQTRILTICDMFDALTAIDRPYRKAVDFHRATQLLREEAARGGIDADLVELLIEVVLPAVVRRDAVSQ